MLKDKIITLSDGRSFIALNELNYLNRIFALCAEVNLDTDGVNDQELVVKEVVLNGEDINLISVSDPAELEAVAKLLISKSQYEAQQEEN